jgi:hypothetical protein
MLDVRFSSVLCQANQRTNEILSASIRVKSWTFFIDTYIPVLFVIVMFCSTFVHRTVITIHYWNDFFSNLAESFLVDWNQMKCSFWTFNKDVHLLFEWRCSTSNDQLLWWPDDIIHIEHRSSRREIPTRRWMSRHTINFDVYSTIMMHHDQKRKQQAYDQRRLLTSLPLIFVSHNS